MMTVTQFYQADMTVSVCAASLDIIHLGFWVFLSFFSHAFLIKTKSMISLNVFSALAQKTYEISLTHAANV